MSAGATTGTEGRPIEFREEEYVSIARSSELLDFVEALVKPVGALSDLRSAAHRVGSPFAATCIDGALGALRNAIAAVHKLEGRMEGGRDRADLYLLPGRIVLRAIPGTAMVERVRLNRQASVGSVCVDRSSDAEPAEVERLLPHDLLADARIAELAHGPVFASLLAAAVGRHRWVHLGTGRMSTMSPPTANMLVSILSGGHRFAALPDRIADAALDVMVSEEMLRIGWRRVQSPASKAGV